MFAKLQSPYNICWGEKNSWASAVKGLGFFKSHIKVLLSFVVTVKLIANECISLDNITRKCEMEQRLKHGWILKNVETGLMQPGGDCPVLGAFLGPFVKHLSLPTSYLKRNLSPLFSVVYKRLVELGQFTRAQNLVNLRAVFSAMLWHAPEIHAVL